tara:strand:- start:559 stop:675 length:117 start_codon:yes stop_codon:yes gene_type:complete
MLAALIVVLIEKQILDGVFTPFEINASRATISLEDAWE